MQVRLQKFLADAGVASRRACEQLIVEGKVTVNGRKVTELGAKVDPGHDRVTFDGRAIKSKERLYLALNKPKGCICSRNDPEGRPSIYELLPREWTGVYTVGRLDFNSEGLIFLTNDGEFSLRLTHPRYGVGKKYIATIDSAVKPELVQTFKEGVFHDGERLKASRARIVVSKPGFSQVEIELSEGKNREIRRLFESQGLVVKKLVRVQIGAIKLGELKPGRWRTLSPSEVQALRNPKPPAAPKPARGRPEKPDAPAKTG